MDPKQIRGSSDYELLDRSELPCPEVWREKATGNLLFIAPDRRGRERVLDQYVVLRDYGAGLLAYEMRENRFSLRARNIFEGAASVLLFLSDDRLKEILLFLRIDYSKIKKIIEKIGEKADSKRLVELVKILDSSEREEIEAIRAAVAEALHGGSFSPAEYKKIRRLCREARR